MEPARFDALVPTLTRSGSRRRALGLLLASALGPATVAAKPAPAGCLGIGKRCSLAAASETPHAKGKGKKGKHHPPSCAKCCSGFGTIGADGKASCTCKGEGLTCASASQCCGGQCRNGNCTGCPPGTVFCPDGCANLQSNNQHCGDCDTACEAGQHCVNGSCVCNGQSCPTGCCDGTTCKRGTSPIACGDNGAPCATCPAGETCPDGTCVCPSSVICPASGCCPHATDVCDRNGACCAPNCGGKVCGDDGCGGQCLPGSCPPCQTCVSGQCRAVPNNTFACDGSALRQIDTVACTVDRQGIGVCVDGACTCEDQVYDPTTNRCLCNAALAAVCANNPDAKCCVVGQVCTNGGTGTGCVACP